MEGRGGEESGAEGGGGDCGRRKGRERRRGGEKRGKGERREGRGGREHVYVWGGFRFKIQGEGTEKRDGEGTEHGDGATNAVDAFLLHLT